MIPSYYKSPNNDFTLIQGDCVDTLSKFKFGFDMVFADPPYFLSSGGVSCHSGKQVSVNKADWDKSLSSKEKLEYNRKWIRLCRKVLKDDGKILFTLDNKVSSTDIGGLEFVEEPSVMRFFIGRLKQVGNWQEKLVAKFKEDFGESL